jgi:hypothetical protein
MFFFLYFCMYVFFYYVIYDKVTMTPQSGRLIYHRLRRGLQKKTDST